MPKPPSHERPYHHGDLRRAIVKAALEILSETQSLEFSLRDDPQIVGLPAASLIEVKNQKPIAEINDLTLVFASVSEKALKQVKLGALELIGDDLPTEKATSLVNKLSGGQWTHDYALTAKEATELGLNVKSGIPASIMELMRLYPQPVRQLPSIEFLPATPSRRAASAEARAYR
jgi:hypothetical protein